MKGTLITIDDPWNPGNPLRRDHPGHALANQLFHNPWDDIDFMGAGLGMGVTIDVKPRDMGSLLAWLKGVDVPPKID
jgi:hypothetical protein